MKSAKSESGCEQDDDGPIFAARNRRSPSHRDEPPGKDEHLRLRKSRCYHTCRDALCPARPIAAIPETPINRNETPGSGNIDHGELSGATMIPNGDDGSGNIDRDAITALVDLYSAQPSLLTSPSIKTVIPNRAAVEELSLDLPELATIRPVRKSLLTVERRPKVPHRNTFDAIQSMEL